MKKNCRIITAALLGALLLSGCHNLYEKLVPKDGNRILSFSAAGKSALIQGERITLAFADTEDISALVPVIRASEKATVIPVTWDYIQAAFPDIDPQSLVNDWMKSENKAAWAIRVIGQHPSFRPPALERAIDFSAPVMFAVISGQGETRLYTVSFSGGKPFDPVPTENTRLLSFSVPDAAGTQVPAKRLEHTPKGLVEFDVPGGVNASSILPQVTVSENASILPLTPSYMRRSFPGVDVFEVILGYYLASNKSEYLRSFIKSADFRPLGSLDEPLDFSGTEAVQFAVIGWDFSVGLYDIKATVPPNDARLTAFGFTKAANPALVRDGAAAIDAQNKKVTVKTVWPYEHTGGNNLLPSFTLAVNGAELYLVNGGTETKLISGSAPAVDCTAGKLTLRVKSGGNQNDYTLDVSKEEDPDTRRSITDLRLYKTLNGALVSDAVAAIHDERGTGSGTITITVPHTGAKPASLTASFISPGTVAKDDGSAFTSGVTGNLAAAEKQYLVCTSKDGAFKRRYEVRLQFSEIPPSALPALHSFGFSAAANGALTQDAMGKIDQNGKIVALEIKHRGGRPQSLIPLFTASGPVSVGGLTQLSGISGQNFTYLVTYTVHDASNAAIKTDYRVQAVFTSDDDNACELSSFVFSAADNPSLASDAAAVVDTTRQTVSVALPFGAGSAARDLTARAAASGTVSVNGASYADGIIRRRWNPAPALTVTSKNGLIRKTYTMRVQETTNIVYVKSDAHFGANNGTSWENAFTSLEAALAWARSPSIPQETRLDFYIADTGTYQPPAGNAFSLRDNSRYYGGFAGNESDPSQRQSGRKTTLKGNGSRVLTAIESERDITLDGFTITGGKAPGEDGLGGGFYLTHKAGANPVTAITACAFTNNNAYWGGGLYGTNVRLAESFFSNNTAVWGRFPVPDPAPYPFGRNSGSGGGAYVTDSTISDSTFTRNVCGTPVRQSGFTWYREMDSGGAGMYAKNSTITNCIFTDNENQSKNDTLDPFDPPTGGGGLYLNGGSTAHCYFENNSSSAGGGLCAIKAEINNCIFRSNTVQASSGGGAYINQSKISDSIFENNSAVHGGALLAWNNTFVDICTFTSNIATKQSGGAISGNAVITNSTFTENSAEFGNGGGVSTGSNIENCIFTSNRANYGGAVDSTGKVINCTFTDNQASSSGGAIRASKTSSVTGGTFSNNRAATEGGAIYFQFYNPYGIFSPLVQGAMFKDNSAPKGGAIHIEYNQEESAQTTSKVTMTITGNTFSGNTAASSTGKIISTAIVGTRQPYIKALAGLKSGGNTGITIPLKQEEVNVASGINLE